MAKGVHFFSVLIVFLSLAFVAHSSCTYVVKLKTGNNDERAGTNAKILLRLYNKKGESVDATSLRRYRDGPNSRNYFEKGQLDRFKIPGKCLKICKMELSHNNGGDHPGWYVNYLEVTVVNDQTQKSSAVKRFNINRWLAKDEPPYSLSVVRNLC
ncbi:PLAT domain-containing protein 3-like [Spinacia oleracea]|uniref:PLAT domain-containing protein 3-like n=1 Tax=Spinacia oleracea TaxID=3562 RepID=A0A9R0I3V1_SPIOL|nr:PLAT domain-containing protein 3-like [Spinacia oleracea]